MKQVDSTILGFAEFSVCILCSFCSLATNAVLADEVVCRWASGEVVIDGVADEAAWQSAAAITNFRIPVSGEPTKTATVARLMWDRQYLYFFAQLEDRDLFADVVERDGQTWDNDVFEMFFKPGKSEAGYYEFQVNAAGTEMDLFLPDQQSGGYAALKFANAFQMKTAVVRRGTLNERGDRDEGWSVEGRIPWIDFMPTGGRPSVDEVWSLALCRYDYTLGESPELSSCAPLSELNFHRVEDYVGLRFAGASESDPQLRKLAERPRFVDAKLTGSPEPPLPYVIARALPHLKLEWPIDVQVEPGTKNLIVITEAGAYGPTLIQRVPADLLSTAEQLVAPELKSELETLVDPQGVAYSIAFHPRFTENGFMYIGSNGKGADDKHRSRITRHTIARTPHNVIGEPLTIIEWESNGHNGAAVTFGTDGLMYVTSGDGTSDSDANNTGQDLTKLLAKVLRIDVDHPTADRAYSIPTDNPFLNHPDARPETWAYGLRNPWRITCDPSNGDIWVGNNGQDMFEQVYRIERGANYGWSVFEGSHPFYSHRQLGPTPHVQPTVEHAHSESRSLTGGVAYHGAKHPELRGAYIYGDYSTGKIWGVKVDHERDGPRIEWQRELADTTLQISAITLDADGELMVVDHRGDALGGLYHLKLNEQIAAPNTFPRKLSETGLFAAVAGHQVAAGVIPYSVNAPFWSDGALKSRFIALPSDSRMEVTDRWSWQFPEKTVLVKSFAIETNDGDPSSRRWIETRLMTKQQGEWVGYSYEWLDDQTDAVLVESTGRDRAFEIRDGSGQRSLQWRYPSRTECMVCHTRAAGFVLGLTTEQLNRSHDYGDGVVVNQLAAFEAMKLLKNDWIPKAKESLRRELQEAGRSQAEIDAHFASAKGVDGQRKPRSSELLGAAADEYPRLSDPYDESQDLEQRARAFLHANCAYCHVESGGGNAQMDLSIYVPLDRMKILNVTPTHHTFDKPDAKIVAEGDPQRSVLWHRVGMRGPGQMPQLATTVVDEAAVAMLKRWIENRR